MGAKPHRRLVQQPPPRGFIIIARAIAKHLLLAARQAWPGQLQATLLQAREVVHSPRSTVGGDVAPLARAPVKRGEGAQQQGCR